MPKERMTEMPSTRLRPPKRYKVIMYNDDFTPMEFVVSVLEQIFGKSHEEAVSLMMGIHKSTGAVVGLYTRDIANTKADNTMDLARQEGYPLKVEAVEE